MSSCESCIVLGHVPTSQGALLPLAGRPAQLELEQLGGHGMLASVRLTSRSAHH